MGSIHKKEEIHQFTYGAASVPLAARAEQLAFSMAPSQPICLFLQPTKFELVINVKTAMVLGLAMSRSDFVLWHAFLVLIVKRPARPVMVLLSPRQTPVEADQPKRPWPGATKHRSTVAQQNWYPTPLGFDGSAR